MDSANPTLAAVAQSGLADDLSQKLMAHAESLGVGQGDVMQQIQSGLAGAAGQAAGRTGMTKLNSRQIFAGQSPLKISMTLLLRAWEDPYGEVQKPFQTLLQMAYSAKLAENQLDFDSGALAAEIQTNGALSSQSAQEAVKALFPSEAPKPVILTYKGERYPPMVIESIGKPLDAPYSPMGDIWLEVPLTLSSVQALDYPDWQKAAAVTLGGMLSGVAAEAVNKAVELFG